MNIYCVCYGKLAKCLPTILVLQVYTNLGPIMGGIGIVGMLPKLPRTILAAKIYPKIAKLYRMGCFGAKIFFGLCSTVSVYA